MHRLENVLASFVLDVCGEDWSTLRGTRAEVGGGFDPSPDHPAMIGQGWKVLVKTTTGVKVGEDEEKSYES